MQRGVCICISYQTRNIVFTRATLSYFDLDVRNTDVYCTLEINPGRTIEHRNPFIEDRNRHEGMKAIACLPCIAAVENRR